MSGQTPDGGMAPNRGRDARVRLVAAPLILLVVCGVLWLQHETESPVGTLLVLALFSAAAGAEMALLFRHAGRPARPLEAAVWCALLPLASLAWWVAGEHSFLLWTHGLSFRPLLLTFAVIYLLFAHLRDTRPGALESIAFRLVPILYVGFLFSWMGDFALSGARTLAWIVLTAKASDMAGWLVGVPFGRHKMIPSVSPGKSWEGTIAGLAASVLVGIFLPDLLDMHVAAWPVAARAAFGFVVGAASILAGVTWSGWKRRMGAKDSSALLPEMGGVMDMVDSLLLAGPAAYLVYVIADACKGY